MKRTQTRHATTRKSTAAVTKKGPPRPTRAAKSAARAPGSKPKSVASDQKITPCLWFNGDGEDAVKFYTSLLPNSRLGRVMRSPVDYPSGKSGDVLTVEFILAGQHYVALNGGPQYQFNPAVSFQIRCEDQAEVDRLWSAVLASGGKEVACGWITDRWGLSWQIFPKRLEELMADPDRARAGRAMEAMMDMVKIDIATIERAVAEK
jgi:predicted 3-demethylubiquinone-9 3-methyltransferase (glyoxalase superfamily)